MEAAAAKNAVGISKSVPRVAKGLELMKNWF